MIQAIAANLFKCFLGLWLLLCPCLAFGQGARSAALQVVFDLDWTLLNSTTEAMAAADPKGVINFQDQLYRIPEGSVESIARLHQAGFQVSIFSGGESARNEFAAQILTAQVNQYLQSKSQSGSFSFNQVLDLQDLLVASTDSKARFAERYKKELSRFFDIQRTLIVDDMKEFAVRGQEKNMVWLGPTYNDRPLFELQSQEDASKKAYSAPNYSEWLRDRQKIVIAVDNILKAAQLMKQKRISLPEAYYYMDPFKSKFSMCGNLFF